jgi:hypothetical protein
VHEAQRFAAELEGEGGPRRMRVSRVTVEFTRPVPIAPLEVEAELAQRGKRVEVVRAHLRAGDGAREIVARATVTRIRVAEVALERLGAVVGDEAPPPPPNASQPFRLPFFSCNVGYHTAIDLRIARGEFGSGAIAAWLRMRGVLVAGRVTAPIERVMVAADSGNGVSCALDYRRHLFINPDLSVHLHRHPVDDWVGLDARTELCEDGIGLARSRLFDAQGTCGYALQSLVLG